MSDRYVWEKFNVVSTNAGISGYVERKTTTTGTLENNALYSYDGVQFNTTTGKYTYGTRNAIKETIPSGTYFGIYTSSTLALVYYAEEDLTVTAERKVFTDSEGNYTGFTYVFSFSPSYKKCMGTAQYIYEYSKGSTSYGNVTNSSSTKYPQDGQQ